MKVHLITNKNHPVVKNDLVEREMLKAIEVYELQKEIDDLISDCLAYKNFFENEFNAQVPLFDAMVVDLFNNKNELNKLSNELRFEVLGKTEERKEA